ncbi:Cobyrinic acid a,c-diamide synthase OS=Streptomyces violarus OX=67380 GN=FHS41_006491 PE=4 SV=1 [Streptomyces violarus]
MSRRVSLPGADELFRTTGGMGLQSSTPRRQANGDARVPGSGGEGDAAAAGAEDVPQSVPAQGGDGEGAEHVAADSDSAEAGESRSRSGSRPAAGGAGQVLPRVRPAPPRRRPASAGGPPRAVPAAVSGTTRRSRCTCRPRSSMDLEHARLVLRGEHGLAVDRGRIVREAVAVVLADLESRGDASILVRRLRGR